MVGIIGGFAAIPAMFMPLIVGPFSDRCRSRLGRRRPYIIVGASIAILGMVGMGMAFSAASLGLYVCGYFVLQVGSNVALGAYSGVIPDLVPKDQVGKASGMLAMMSQLGTLTGALVTGMVLHASVLCLYVMAGVVAIFALFTWATLDETPLTEELPKLDWKQYFKSLWIDPKVHPDFAWVWLTRALMMLAFYMIQPFLTYYLRDVIHVRHPESQSAVVLGVILIFATFSGYFGGRLSDIIGRKKIVTMSTVLISIMCVVFIFLHSLLAALMAGIIFGIGYGAYISVDWALGTDVLPNKDEAGTDMAVWHVAMTVPQVIAGFISGKLILDHFAGPTILVDGKEIGTYQWAGYAAIFALAAVVFFTSGVMVKKVKGST
jgi:MFS family permease